MTCRSRQGPRRRAARAAAARALAGLAVCGLVACAPSTNKNDDPVEQKSGPATLVIWADPAREALVDAYRSAHPDVTVKVEEVPNDPTTVNQKLLLANRAGKGWPDLLFIAPFAVSDLADDPYNFAADISSLIDESLLAQFSPGAETPCEIDGKIYCVRNDVAPTVLYYNKKLMSQFGYQVPTTWEQFRDLGVRLAHEHPGYIVGSAADNFIDQAIFATTKCPVHQVVGDKKLLTNLSDPACTKVATMLDTLLTAKAMSNVAVNDPGFVKTYGVPQKVLMMPGAVYTVNTLWKQLYKVPAGTLAMAPPLKWASDSQVFNSNVGGGSWVVSRHSSYQQAATDAAMWMAAGPPAVGQVELKATVFTAFKPGQANWVKVQEGTGYVSAVGGISSVVATASAQVWPGWTQPDIQNIDFRTQKTALANGSSVTSVLSAWQTRITQEAQAAGWTVVHS